MTAPLTPERIAEIRARVDDYSVEVGDLHNWLDEVLDEAERLQSLFQTTHHVHSDWVHEVTKLRAERDRYRAALTDILNPDVTPVLNDCTDRARLALVGERG